MNALVERNLDTVSEICRRFRVRRLYLFGSAATDRFDPQGSDLDFLVRFLDRQPTGAYADRVLGFSEALEQIFGRHVDVITEESVRNPYFRREIERTRLLVYECADQEAAA
ncbi:nucleotidyltransferase domain-containing protein [Candidatus Binatia bacterium]|nr:nucleotidyltransferase domain-containing protein [Candidatus Binatia bacterium]